MYIRACKGWSKQSHRRLDKNLIVSYHKLTLLGSEVEHMSTKEIKILLIEDDRKDARLIQTMLGDAADIAFDMEVFGRLSTGLERLAEGDIDLVLLDLTLPDSRGLKSLSKVRSQTSEVPVIIITGLDDEGAALEALQRGAQDYLIKGQVDSDMLSRSIRYALERQSIDREARKAERRFYAFFDNPLNMVFICDERGVFVDANPHALDRMGFTDEDKGKATFQDVIHPDDLPRALQVLSQVVTKGYVEDSGEIRVATKSGEERWVEVYGSLIEQEGEHIEALAIVRDVTERREADEKLKDLVEKLRLSQEALSTPVVQIWDKVLALPLIGVIDDHRAQRIMEVLLDKIVNTRSEVVIIDVTGVASIDTHVTNHLVQTIESVSLLGAQCVLTGIQPDVAQVLIGLGVDLSKMLVKRDMQDGLKWALQNLGYGTERRAPVRMVGPQQKAAPDSKHRANTADKKREAR
jgi:anti-anti-sigma factor